MRLVDIHSTRYAIARRYMIRLRRDDFEDEHELAKFAATAGIALEFRDEFEYLVPDETAARCSAPRATASRSRRPRRGSAPGPEGPGVPHTYAPANWIRSKTSVGIRKVE